MLPLIMDVADRLSLSPTTKQRSDANRPPVLAQMFEAAMDLDTEDLPAFLDRECAGNTSLRNELEELLCVDRLALGTNSTCGDTGKKRHAKKDPQKDPPPDSMLVSGLRIHQYELIRELGHGGMGVVYLSRDTQLGRCVAIKFLHSNSGALTQRFLVEARLTARCNHENIVVIHEVSEFQDLFFMVLEYLRGHTLTEELGGHPIPFTRAVQLLTPVVRALQYAHDLGIVHRDLKPDNVIVTDSGTIKVLDFGIAKVLSEAGARPQATGRNTAIDPHTLSDLASTRDGTLIGTMPYMAPEQWRGEIDRIDHRTDLWAIGIMLYEMITGRHPLAPLDGYQLALIGREDHEMPRIASAQVGIPAELAGAIDRCLYKPMDRRMGSAGELLDTLERCLPDRQARELRAHESPYPGLAAFQESDASRFFGRSHDVAFMLAQLRSRPMMGVVGPSGVGKSSFVRAGVIPALKSSGEAWQAVVLRPSRQPLWALAAALSTMVTSAPLSSEPHDLQTIVSRLQSEPGYAGRLLRNWADTHKTKVLLFVDQFEELYTVADESERHLFTCCLQGVADDHTSPLRLVISIRSDFVDRVAESRQLMRDLTPGLIFLPQPDRDGLREAIVEPARMFGYEFESPQMSEHMIDALATTPGALPLLQFAATKLWDLRDRQNKLLTAHSYKQIGGVAGALASHADAVLNGLHPRDQKLVRAIFERLVTTERTRAIASVSELCELSDNPDDVQRLIDLLVNARLLVVQESHGDEGADDGASVEIVHEAMIETWPRLAHWLEEHHEDLLMLEQLRTTAKQWEQSGRPRGMLWRAEAMDKARRWHDRYRGPLTHLQRDYLAAVSALAARSTRNKRLLLASTMAFLSLLVVAAAVALVWINSARSQARDAAAQARVSERQARAAETQARASERQARAAEEETRQRFEQLQEARTGWAKAEKRAGDLGEQVEDSKEALKDKNRELVNALAKAQAASLRAQDAAERAENKAEAYRQAKAEAEDARKMAMQLLAKERARVQALIKTIGAKAASALKK